MGLVGLAAVAAAPVGGWSADRTGHGPVVLVAVAVFGLGLLVPLFATDPRFVEGIVPAAFAAVVLSVLPYSMPMGLLPEERHGVGASPFGFGRGVGALAGPLIAGAAVGLLGCADFLVFEETGGSSAAFAATAVFLLASIPVLRRIGVGRGDGG